MSDSASFYDSYVDRQQAVGVNERHRSILAGLLRCGLRPEHRVLEIGSGVGTLTVLLAGALPQGSLVGIDLSPKSIEAARARLARFADVELIAGDVLEAGIEGRFDVVVLPDVIEHVPVELHGALFARVAGWVRDDGFVFVHYPDPHHLEWTRRNEPEKLQLVDQPIHADVLTANAYANGLYLERYERYSIWVREGDYVIAVLRPAAGVGEFHHLPPRRPSLAARATARLRRLAGRGRP